MIMFNNNKISLNVPGVPRIRFSNIFQCNYINVCRFTSIYAKKYEFGRGEGNNKKATICQIYPRYRLYISHV